MSNPSLKDCVKGWARSGDTYLQFSAVLLALQIPSVLSRIEIPRTAANTGDDKASREQMYYCNKQPRDCNLYRKWLNLHKESFRCWYQGAVPFDWLCSAIYELRNHVTHNANIRDPSLRIVLVNSPQGTGSMFSGARLYVTVADFCAVMFDAATMWPVPEFIDAYKETSLLGYDHVDVLSPSRYNDLKEELCEKLSKFWGGREKDHELYLRFAQMQRFSAEGLNIVINNNSEFCLEGMTRKETERVARIALKFNAFVVDLDKRIAVKYLK